MTEAQSTTFALDCPDTHTLEIFVKGGRLESIRGGDDHPNTRGPICSKAAHFARRVYNEDRLLIPLKRRAAHVSEVGGGACYNDARVEVERMG